MPQSRVLGTARTRGIERGPAALGSKPAALGSNRGWQSHGWHSRGPDLVTAVGNNYDRSRGKRMIFQTMHRSRGN